MSEFDHPLWRLWWKRRLLQLRVGQISALFFLVAVLALSDGLQMLVRTDTNEITLLAGENEGLSGPCPFQNPVQSDLEAQFSQDAPCRFELEGFFAGYLIGNGMWRGVVSAHPDAQTGTYVLDVVFRGMTGAAQRFVVHVFRDEEERALASPSFSLRYLQCPPFILCACLGGMGLLFGTGSMVLGRRNLALIQDLGFSEIFRTSPAHTDPMQLWCSAQGATVQGRDALEVYSVQGEFLAQATIVTCEKNVFCLTTAADPCITSGCLVKIRL